MNSVIEFECQKIEIILVRIRNGDYKYHQSDVYRKLVEARTMLDRLTYEPDSRDK